MCRAIDPNSPDSIEIFIKAIADDISQIYARHALYSINTQKGVETFLQSASENPKFIHEFLDNESIFNNKDKQADNELIGNIQKNKNASVITLLKKIIVSAYTGERNYDAGKSYFLQQIVLIIQSENPDYLDELIKTITELPPEKKQILFINDIENILSVLLQPESLEELREIFKDELHHHAGYSLAEAVRRAPYTGNPSGDAVLKKGIELGITVDPKTYQKHDDYQKQQDERMYEQFKDYLSPPIKGQYFPQVFRYYIENKEKLEKMWTPEEKERLLWLADDSNLTKIDPKKIEVHYKDPTTKSGEYTISSSAAYFGDVLQVIQILKPSLLQAPENRQKVIDFIPFSYLSDFRQIDEILGKLTDKELSTLDEIMFNKEKDVRYLIPQTYIYISKTHPELKSPKRILLSFVTDPLISESDREYALENLERHISPSDSDVKELLKKLWEPNTRNQISDLANGLLISVFRDEEAIKWRFNTLKSSATPFRRQEGFHSMGNIEMELDSKAFAKPLINLNDEKYLDRFIDLLEFSLTLVEKPDHREYVSYLWSIVISFIARDDFLLSIEALTALKSWAEQHLDNPEINWLLKRISELSAQNNLVIKIVKSENALAFIKGKKITWTYPLLRGAMKDAGSEQDIDIFISHASASTDAAVGENSFIKKLNKKIKDKGYKTFLDEEFNTPTIKEKINKYLPKSRFMIVVCSERYRKRVCEDGAKEVSTELFHFSEIEEVTKLPLIFPVTYKITRERWKIIGVPELKGNRIQEAAMYDADGEVDKVVDALLKWVEKNDPETAKKLKQ